MPFDSYFSGNTVQICPVGALTGAAYRFRARPFDLVSTPSVCEHCAAGCRQRTDHRRGAVTRRLAGNDPQVNEEWNCDKGRWAFTYATQPDRLTGPLVRNADGVLVPASWPEAFAAAARGLAAARGRAGVLTGGRLTIEDAYAYAKFARVALGSNDIDMRARPHSAEETEFLAGRVAGHGIDVSYTDLERAPAVLLAGFEPDDESPIVFLRLRKAARARHADRLLDRRAGQPRADPDVRGAAAHRAGRRGRRAGQPDQRHRPGRGGPRGGRGAGRRRAPSSWSASGWPRCPARSAPPTGWPGRPAPGWPGCPGGPASGAPSRRARCPTCCPAGGWWPARRPAPRWPGPGAWPRCRPSRAGTPGRSWPPRERDLDALLVGGVDLDDLPDPAAARAALEAAPFVVSLELRPSAVTDRADVVLPVAAVAEKDGTFVNWEGRPGTFGPALQVPGIESDLHVLRRIADEMDVHLGLPDAAAARAELAALGAGAGSADQAETAHGAPLASVPETRPPRARPGRRRSWPPGASCSTPGGCRTASRSWPARPGRWWPGCRRRPRRRPAWPTAVRSLLPLTVVR